MNNGQYHYDDISDEVWALLEPHLLGREGQWGGVAEDNRQFLNGVFWKIRTGAPWRELPPEFGKWNSTYMRFRRWREKGIWEPILEILIDEPEFEWLMLERNPAPLSSDSVEERNGQEEYIEGIQIYVWPWLEMVCRSKYLRCKVPLRIENKLLR